MLWRKLGNRTDPQRNKLHNFFQSAVTDALLVMPFCGNNYFCNILKFGAWLLIVSLSFVILIWCSPFSPSQFLAQVLCAVSQPWCARITAHFTSGISPSDGHLLFKLHESTPHLVGTENDILESNFWKNLHFHRNTQFQTVFHMHFDLREKVLSLCRQREWHFGTLFLKKFYFQMVAQFEYRCSMHFAERIRELPF